jgi:ankyrin repeat protein
MAIGVTTNERKEHVPETRTPRLARQFSFHAATQPSLSKEQKQILSLLITKDSSANLSETINLRSLILNLEFAQAKILSELWGILLAPKIIDSKDPNPYEQCWNYFNRLDLEQKKAAIRALQAALQTKKFEHENLNIRFWLKNLIEGAQQLIKFIGPRVSSEISLALTEAYQQELFNIINNACEQLLIINASNTFNESLKRLQVSAKTKSEQAAEEQVNLSERISELQEEHIEKTHRITTTHLLQLTPKEKPLTEDEFRKEFSLTDLNYQDSNGDTLFHHAVRNENIEFIYFLLKGNDITDKAKMDIQNNQGDTVFHLAAQTGNPQILRLLQQHYKPQQAATDAKPAADSKEPVNANPWLQVNKQELTPLAIAFYNVREGKQAEDTKEQQERAEKLHRVFERLRKQLFQELDRKLLLGSEILDTRKKLAAVDRAMLSLATQSKKPSEALTILERELSVITQQQRRRESWPTKAFRLAEQFFTTKQKELPVAEQKLIAEISTTLDQKKKVYGGTRLHAAIEGLDKNYFHDWAHRASVNPVGATVQDLFTVDGENRSPIDLLANEFERQRNEARSYSQVQVFALQVFHEAEASLHKKLSEHKNTPEEQIFTERLQLINQAKKTLIDMQVLDRKQALQLVKIKLEALMDKKIIRDSRGKWQSNSDTYHELQKQARKVEQKIKVIEAEEKTESIHRHVAAAVA